MKTIEIPTTGAEIITHPEKAIEAFEALAALCDLHLQLVVPSAVQTATAPQPCLIGEAPKVVLSLPLKFKSRVSAPSGGATQDTELRTKFAELLDRMTETGMNP